MLLAIVIVIALIALWRIGSALNRMAPKPDEDQPKEGSVFGTVIFCLVVFIGCVIAISQVVDIAAKKPVPQYKTAAERIEAEKLNEWRHQTP